MHNKFQDLENEMNQYILEREEEIHGLILALLSRHHLFLVGPPGTAKSLMIRMLSDTLNGANYFKRLLTKTTTDEEIFGPLKISQLKHDKYVRKIDGFMPTAHFAYLDEIFKCNSNILNSLLNILQERKYDHDDQEIDVPLETCMSSSNEIPTDQDELEALWDRFVLKYKVDRIQGEKEFETMLVSDDSPDLKVDLSLNEIHEAQKMVDDITISKDILEETYKMRKHLAKKGIKPSDRRYKQAIKVVKAQAYMNGRDEVHIDDLSVLSHILWNDTKEISIVRDVVKDYTNPWLNKAEQWIDAVTNAYNEVLKMNERKKLLEEKEEHDELKTKEKEELENIRNGWSGSVSEKTAKITKASKKMKELKTEMEEQDRDTEKIDEYLEIAKEKHDTLVQEYLMMDLG